MERILFKEVFDGALAIRKTENGDVELMHLAGELDLSNAPSLELELRRVERERRSVVIDMRALEFIDSTGIALLVAAHRRLNEGAAAPRMTIVPSRNDAVVNVFAMTGIDRLLPGAGSSLSAA